MKRIFTAILAMLLVFVLCGSALADETKLSVRGTGVVSVTADQAQIILGVRESAADVLEAQGTVNAKINAICAGLLAAGVEQKDIGTESLYIYANYDYSSDEPKLVGYTATNSILITAADIEKVGEYIDIAFANGANTLDQVSFSAQNSEDAQKEALRLAVANAREKGEVIAEAAGMKISSIESITESSDYYYGGDLGAKYSNARAEMTAGADTSTSVSASTIEITATVLVEFELR